MRSLHCADSDNAQEAALCLEQTVNDYGEGDADSGVDSVLDSGKDGNQYTGEKDDDINGRDTPELVNDLGGSDDITDGVDNDSR